MKGKSDFTSSEAGKIRKLLEEKCKVASERQKKYRDKLRSLDFYISDFTKSKAGFTVADFDELVRVGSVIIVP